MKARPNSKYYGDHRGYALSVCKQPTRQCLKHGINLPRLRAEDVLKLARGQVTPRVADAAFEEMMRRGFLERDDTEEE